TGMPRRVGLVLANEFSDHKLESKNYLCLAHSKLRCCALGPELIVGADFTDARGTVRIERAGKVIWSKKFATGENNMSHSLANLEHHHFKYAQHRRHGDAHVHFLGADAFSFGDGIELQDGDVMAIELAGFGRALRNPIRIDRSPPQFVSVQQL
ncbi:MAG TPA: GguC protein, partial [Verrucomicrobiae bacterium]|nr:GguC protein [Verrucomicrobiae bacterium]